MKRVYVGVYPDIDSQDKLLTFAHDHGFDTSKGYGGSPFEFHTTIITSINESAVPRIDDLIYSSAVPVIGRPSSIATIGDNNYWAIYLDDVNNTLTRIRETCEKRFKLIPQYRFNPHITLSYLPNNSEKIKGMKLPDFDIVFDRIRIEDALEPVETKTSNIIKGFKNFFKTT